MLWLEGSVSFLQELQGNKRTSVEYDEAFPFPDMRMPGCRYYSGYTTTHWQRLGCRCGLQALWRQQGLGVYLDCSGFPAS
jgi:hypothetical protein